MKKQPEIEQPHPKTENAATLSRRTFLTGSTAAGAAAAGFQIIRPELVRGAGNEKLKIGIVGCGGRGTRGVYEFLTGNPNAELVAMADLFEDQLERSIRRLRDPQEFAGIQERIKVEPDHRFIGFDAYKKLLQSDIDIVMLHTPPGWRPVHFEAAVNAKKHIFAEKPLGTDPVGVRRVFAAAKKSEQLKLTVMIGAQRRSQKEYVESVKRIHDGDIGDVVATYANWVGGPVIKGKEFLGKKKGMEWQHRAWYSYVWICGDQVVEQHLHNIDVINWVMGTHPVSVVASGGAAWRPREMIYGNIYDHLYADFVYPNGVRMTSHCRQYPTGVSMVNELVVGTKGKTDCRDLGTKAEISPYVQETIDMVNSILGNGPYQNRAMAVGESTMTCIMARESAYSGIEVTWDMIMKSKLNLMPKDPASVTLEDEVNIPPLPVPGEYKFT
jgi:myo-inositol 2-dehydrogenase / D-chiro-inositol 1-dehydrogenase